MSCCGDQTRALAFCSRLLSLSYDFSLCVPVTLMLGDEPSLRVSRVRLRQPMPRGKVQAAGGSVGAEAEKRTKAQNTRVLSFVARSFVHSLALLSPFSLSHTCTLAHTHTHRESLFLCPLVDSGMRRTH